MTNPFETVPSVEVGSAGIVSTDEPPIAAQEGWALSSAFDRETVVGASVGAVEGEPEFDAPGHFKEVQRRIVEMLDLKALFSLLHPSDQRALVQILNKGGNPNNRHLESMTVAEISGGLARFEADQPHTTEEIKAICQRHFAQFRSRLRASESPISSDFLLGIAPGVSAETVESHYRSLYAVA